MPHAPQDGPSLSGALTRVETVLDGLGIGASISPGVRDRARESAAALLNACGGAPEALPLAVVAFAAEVTGALATGVGGGDTDLVRRAVDALGDGAGVPPVALGRELLRAPRPDLPAPDALAAQLSLLRSLSGARAVSLWLDEGDGAARRIAQAADVPSDAATAAAVRAVLESAQSGPVTSSGADPESGAGVIGVRIAGRPHAGALLVHGTAPGAAGPGPLLAAAAPGIAGLLEREALLDREHWRELVAGAVERRLARVRFDLHDGPQQDVILLAQDVRLFRDQLRPLLDGDPDQARALGRLDDLEAQLLALDGDLRRLSTSVQSPFLSAGSLLDSLQRVVGAFAKRTGVLPQTDFSADLTQLSESQQIALLALVQEALSNVRKHGDASSVQVSIVPDEDGIRAQVIDDGRGFDPETTVTRAAQAGRLGLVGMHERVRMLGGQTRVDSRPGGPTVVSATLPRWGGEED